MGGDVEAAATPAGPKKTGMYAGQVPIGESAGVGAAATILVRNSTVDAGVRAGAHVDADGGTGLTVKGNQSGNIPLLAVGGSGGETAGVAGSVTVDVFTDVTKAHIDSGVIVGDAPSAGLTVDATDTTSILAIAGALSVGGTAGVGAGIDVEVVNKDTEASFAGHAKLSGDAAVTSTSKENLVSIAVGGSFGGTAAVSVNVSVPVFSVTTLAFVAAGAYLDAGGSGMVAANETMKLDAIGGHLPASP